MPEVWIGTEYHGELCVFSTREKAEVWFEHEVRINCVRREEDAPDIEEFSNERSHYMYVEGELVARIERYEIDVY